MTLDEWFGILWISVMFYVILRIVNEEGIIPSKKKKDRFEEYRLAYQNVISFTIHENVSAEVVRWWDSEARRLSDTIGRNAGFPIYDEMMLEMEQVEFFDTSWWKE